MGAYLSEPMTQKNSEDGEGNKLKFGACSMQGWRVSQEDAHNCIACFDDNSSLFAVYDGHGGAEVAIYLSKHLPDTLKACISYKNGEFVKALEECYLKIDASIKTPEVLKEIQQLAKSTNRGDNDAEASVDYEEENVGVLYEEATMPLDKLVAKYASANEEGSSGAAAEEEDPDCKPGSSKSIKCHAAPSSSSAAGPSSSSVSSSCPNSSSASAGTNIKVNGESSGCGSSSSGSSGTPSEEIKTEITEVSSSSNELIVEGKKIELKAPESEKEIENAEISEKVEANTKDEVESSPSVVNGNSASVEAVSNKNGEMQKENEESLKLSENGDEKPSSTTVNGGSGDNSNASTNGEGPKTETAEPTTTTGTPRRKKVHPVPIAIPEESKQQEKRTSSPRKSAQFANEAGFGYSDSEDSDEDDAGYTMGDSSEDSELDDEEEDEDIGEDSDEDDDEEEDYDDEDAEEDERFLNEMQEPGYDSGATAVVCFMKWEADGLSLWVANAGDSRCVVCREGQAVDMSHDHKPELDVEAQRIVKAGGKVTEDGRVNGGLNLSRALGDHSYKQNQSLPPEEQMISPLPSVEHILLNPTKDKFVVLACDGIWNSMSSQEVVNFVGDRIDKSEALSKICEELFDSCLAQDTCGDGTGCDNMTCIIVKLSDAPEVYSGSKRKTSPSEEISSEESDTSKKSRVEVEVQESCDD